jgi:hypothetical protein
MSKKKYISLLLVLMMILTANPAYANEEIKVYVDDTQIKFDASPMVRDGRLLVPFRPFAEALGANVSWNSKIQKVTVQKDDIIIELTVGSKSARMNEEIILLETVPIITNNRVFVPLRFVGDSLGAIVSWNEQSRTVTVSRELLYSDEDEILSVVRQLDTNNNQLDLDTFKSIFTNYYIEEEFGSEEELKTFIEKSNFSKEKFELLDIVLYELRDSFAEVYFLAKTENGPYVHYSNGYMILKEVDGRWQIGAIYDNELSHLEDQILKNSQLEAFRDDEIDEGIRTSILATMQQYNEAVEERDQEKLFKTIDENLQRISLQWEEDFESDDENKEAVTLEDQHLDILQTNGELAYVKYTFRLRLNGEVEDFRFLYMLKNTESSWIIYDRFWFVNPFSAH